MATRKTVHCVLCGYDVPPGRLGLVEGGGYDAASAPQHEMGLRVDVIGGRGRLSVTREPLPIEYAYGLRAALKAALGRVEADIVEATGELPEDDAA